MMQLNSSFRLMNASARLRWKRAAACVVQEVMRFVQDHAVRQADPAPQQREHGQHVPHVREKICG